MAAALEPIDVTLKMVIIFDPLCRSGLVVGASRERVALEGFGQDVIAYRCAKRKGAGGR